jgi:hypothetical protein
MVEVSINRGRHLITFRASGSISVDELQQISADGRLLIDAFRNEPHIVLADMRGLPPLNEERQKIFGEMIRYDRERGCILCVHLSDSSIARLQQARIAREASTYDDVTVNVISPEEAEKLINESQSKLKAKK